MHLDANLDDDLQLSDLIKPESLRNLCAKFSAFGQMGILVMDGTGDTLLGSRGPRFCSKPGSDGDHGQECEACRILLSAADDGLEKYAAYSCTSGLKYLRARVDNQLKPIGFLCFGPIAEEPLVVSRLGDALVASSAELQEHDLKNIPVLTVGAASKMLEFFCDVIEEMVYANYERYLSAGLSRQYTSEMLSELVDKETELSRFQETLKDSEDLRALF